MQVFVTGTDTDIGKTLICSWLCLHSGHSYFKPIQSGDLQNTDSKIVKLLSNVKIYPEVYNFKNPYSPHLAARLENIKINTSRIILPEDKNLIVEGAGGVLVPLNETELIIDLIIKLNIPVILIASSRLGTINHTLLTLKALRDNHIDILGVIINGELNSENAKAIEYYGNVKILYEFPKLKIVNNEQLKTINLNRTLKTLFEIK